VQDGTQQVRCTAVTINVFTSATTVSFDSMVINANDQNDTITIEALDDPATVNGGSGDDSFNVQQVDAALRVNTDAGNDTVNAGSAAPSMQGTLSLLDATVTINGGDSDQLNLGHGASSDVTFGTIDLKSSASPRNITAAGLFQINLVGSPVAGGVSYYAGNQTDVIALLSTNVNEPINLFGNGNADIFNLGNGDMRAIDAPVCTLASTTAAPMSTSSSTTRMTPAAMARCSLAPRP
jgi:hypothetical protein